ncbi:hypothetical protein B0A48_15292 [Cryoendolithus antarcticus]|uniref:Uncharacterized protein n=1 Tax=Cryoendolithus antarcticus TaxID=1507870 RepID=A0A1V8SII3_9PEZI|nr:hypothetical protein B0A48_15292 [Cryoendolithus antarcticus]
MDPVDFRERDANGEAHNEDGREYARLRRDLLLHANEADNMDENAERRQELERQIQETEDAGEVAAARAIRLRTRCGFAADSLQQIRPVCVLGNMIPFAVDSPPPRNSKAEYLALLLLPLFIKPYLSSNRNMSSNVWDVYCAKGGFKHADVYSDYESCGACMLLNPNLPARPAPQRHNSNSEANVIPQRIAAQSAHEARTTGQSGMRAFPSIPDRRRAAAAAAQGHPPPNTGATRPVRVAEPSYRYKVAVYTQYIYTAIDGSDELFDEIFYTRWKDSFYGEAYEASGASLVDFILSRGPQGTLLDVYNLPDYHEHFLCEYDFSDNHYPTPIAYTHGTASLPASQPLTPTPRKPANKKKANDASLPASLTASLTPKKKPTPKKKATTGAGKRGKPTSQDTNNDDDDEGSLFVKRIKKERTFKALKINPAQPPAFINLDTPLRIKKERTFSTPKVNPTQPPPFVELDTLLPLPSRQSSPELSEQALQNAATDAWPNAKAEKLALANLRKFDVAGRIMETSEGKDAPDPCICEATLKKSEALAKIVLKLGKKRDAAEEDLSPIVSKAEAKINEACGEALKVLGETRTETVQAIKKLNRDLITKFNTDTAKAMNAAEASSEAIGQLKTMNDAAIANLQKAYEGEWQRFAIASSEAKENMAAAPKPQTQREAGSEAHSESVKQLIVLVKEMDKRIGASEAAASSFTSHIARVEEVNGQLVADLAAAKQEIEMLKGTMVNGGDDAMEE